MRATGYRTHLERSSAAVSGTAYSPISSSPTEQSTKLSITIHTSHKRRKNTYFFRDYFSKEENIWDSDVRILQVLHENISHMKI